MEEWKDIEGWEGKYQVSNYGDIKRLERDITDSLGRTKHYTEKIFHPHKANNGYTRVSFGTERDLTHRVVAKAFLPNPRNLPEVNHKDGHRKDFNFAGTKENNYEDGNLEWVDRKENMLHASRTGLINKDSKKRKISTALNQKKSVEKALAEGRPVPKGRRCCNRCNSRTLSAPRSSGSASRTSAICGTTRPTSLRSTPPPFFRAWWRWRVSVCRWAWRCLQTALSKAP